VDHFFKNFGAIQNLSVDYVLKRNAFAKASRQSAGVEVLAKM